MLGCHWIGSLIFERILIPASAGLSSLKKRKGTTVH